jgi:D-amino-acid dehydrogenase
MANRDILVIGAGVIGLSCAVEFAKRGAAVTVIDKSRPGTGCSYGNAGWMTPCFAQPLPAPGMLLKSIKWLLNPDSPLYIKPSLSPHFLGWMTRFMLAMNQRAMNRSTDVLTRLAKYSLDSFQDLDRQFPGAFGFERKGLLMVSQSEEGLNGTVGTMNLVARFGVRGERLDAKQVLDLEPSLHGPIKGGVFFPDEAHAEPYKVVETLANLATSLGVKIVNGCEAFDFNVANGTLREVKTTLGPMHSDVVVLATASWSRPIAKKLRVSIPILGGKGYAIITDPLTPISPRVPLMLGDTKIAITPRNGTMRIAGTLELVDQDESITARRVAAIIKGTRPFLKLPETPVIHEVWRGLRPCTPDGVPLIGFVKQPSNVFLCTGHQMIGLLSAPGSARLAADLIFETPPLVDPAPFDPNRF